MIGKLVMGDHATPLSTLFYTQKFLVTTDCAVLSEYT